MFSLYPKHSYGWLINAAALFWLRSVLESRAVFLPWYGFIVGTLGELVKRMSDIEVMEFVSSDGILTVPILGVGEESRPTPVIQFTMRGEEVTFAITYTELDAFRHLKNILHATQTQELDAFKAAMRLLLHIV